MHSDRLRTINKMNTGTSRIELQLSNIHDAVGERTAIFHCNNEVRQKQHQLL